MKLPISLIALTLAATCAPAAPYLVYTGSDYAYSFPSIDNTATEQQLYLVTDLADTSTFAILEINRLTGTYTILARPFASPTTEETNNNFFGSVPATGGRAGGTAILAFGDDTVDGSGTTTVSHAYGTGPLTTSTLRLVPARTRTLTVTERTDGQVVDTVTFPPSAAITTAGTPLATNVSGALFSYRIASDGTLPQATAPGNFGIGLSAFYTQLANIGGALQAGRNVYAVQPVTVTTTEEDAFTTFLTNLATDFGVTVASPNVVITNTSVSGGSLTLNGSGASGSSTAVSSGPTGAGTSTSPISESGGIVTIGSGTLQVGTGTTYDGTLLTGSGTLSLGGSGTTTVNGATGP
jgi:hypothetical protein